jgi:hypothetical protein
MAAKKKTDVGIDWATELGASRVVPVENGTAPSVPSLLALCAEISKRIRSSGGRPTDPDWTVARQVPFRAATWSSLQEMAQRLRALKANVSPAQLAALFVEQGIEAFRRLAPPESSQKRSRARKAA